MADLFRSTVFRWILVYSAAFLVVALAILLIWGVLAMQRIEAEEKDVLTEIAEFVEDLLREERLSALIEEFETDEGAEWSDELTHFRLSEEEPVIALRLVTGKLVYGVEDLPYQEGWHWREIFTEDDEFLVRGLGFEVEDANGGDDFAVVVARPRSFDYYVAREAIEYGVVMLFVIVVPLAFLNAGLASRRVLRRLQRLARTFGGIAHGKLEERIPVSPRNDEFDRLALRFNRMLDAIGKLDRNYEDVTIGVAHDLRTPIARLGQRLQGIRQDAADPDAVHRGLDRAEQEIDGIIKTFEALLRMGEIQSGRRKQQFRRVDLSELARDMAASYAPVFESAGRGLESSILPSIRILGDGDLIAQAISNLLENSIEHGRTGGQTWIRLQTTAKGAVLQVGDDGPGIPSPLRERIFERFVRGDQARHSPGNGLGLSLVRAIAELHDARLTLHAHTSGTVIDLEFPRPTAEAR